MHQAVVYLCRDNCTVHLNILISLTSSAFIPNSMRILYSAPDYVIGFLEVYKELMYHTAVLPFCLVSCDCGMCDE